MSAVDSGVGECVTGRGVMICATRPVGGPAAGVLLGDSNRLRTAGGSRLCALVSGCFVSCRSGSGCGSLCICRIVGDNDCAPYDGRMVNTVNISGRTGFNCCRGVGNSRLFEVPSLVFSTRTVNNRRAENFVCGVGGAFGGFCVHTGVSAAL